MVFFSLIRTFAAQINNLQDEKNYIINYPAVLGVMMMAQTPFGKGQLKVSKVARNAVRIQYTTDNAKTNVLPDWLYVKHDEVESQDISTKIDAEGQTITIKDKNGKPVFKATQHQLIDGQATLAFDSPEDEFLFGLGQFQDGYSNVRGLSRRLTQVNTQISMPMVLSNLGYGVLWNNYGMTEFNPSETSVCLERSQETGVRSQENRPERRRGSGRRRHGGARECSDGRRQGQVGRRRPEPRWESGCRRHRDAREHDQEPEISQTRVCHFDTPSITESIVSL